MSILGDDEKGQPRISRIRVDQPEVSHRYARIHTDFQRGHFCSSVSVCVHPWLFILVALVAAEGRANFSALSVVYLPFITQCAKRAKSTGPAKKKLSVKMSEPE
jgi:hypothetical protein